MESSNVVDHLFAAIVAGDAAAVRACFSADARIWHGYDCIALDLDTFMKGLEAAFDAGTPLRYDDIRRIRTEDGYVQHHLFVAPSPEGGWTAKPCCNVFHLRDGLIHRAEEYLDCGFAAKVAELPAVTPGLPPR